MTLLFGLAALAVLLWMAQKYLQADPRKLAAMAKPAAGTAALGFAGFLALRGQYAIAAPLAFVGFGLLGWMPFGPAGFGARTQKSTGQISRVRSAFLEMELDHDTGDMGGTVLAGPFAGRSLQELDETALRQVYEDCRRGDRDGVRLLEAYLDRRFAGWREDAEGDGDAGSHAGAQPGPMTEQEAYQILGLQPGAGAEEVRRAHRALMLKLHPDQGGTTYLAARINEAKDVLLGRHR